MALTTGVPRTCVYKGLVTVPIRTFTTTYPTLNGAWLFSTNCPLPVEMRGFLNTSAGPTAYPTGIYANFLDLTSATGYTAFAYGDQTLAHENTPIFFGSGGLGTFNGCNWRNGRMYGWCYNQSGATQWWCYDMPAVPNNPVTALFTPAKSVTLLPTITSNQDSRFIPNCDSPFGAISQATVATINEFTYAISSPGFSLLTNGPNVLNFNLSNMFHILSGGPPVVALGQSFLVAQNPSNPTDPTSILMSSDFVNTTIQYVLNYINPPGTLDVNTALTNGGSGTPNIMPTFNGFMFVGSTTVTVEGQTLNGWGVFISPDFTQYVVIRFLPTDSLTSTMFTLPGVYQAKFDTTGALWLKNVNSQTNVFVSASPVLKQLPVFPPFPIPDGLDTDPVVTMMRDNLSKQ